MHYSSMSQHTKPACNCAVKKSYGTSGHYIQRGCTPLDCRGKQIHDANVAATALVHGVRRILTANVGDFQRFESYVEILDLAEAKAPVTDSKSNEN